VKGKPPGMLKRLVGALSTAREGTLNGWQPAGQSYPRLDKIDLQVLTGHSGLFALWHLGVRPQWLRVGFAPDLGQAVDEISSHPEIAEFDAHGGLYMSWYFCPAEAASGLVNYLAPRLQPALQALALDSEMRIDVTVAAASCDSPPGTAAVWSALEPYADHK